MPLLVNNSAQNKFKSPLANFVQHKRKISEGGATSDKQFVRNSIEEQKKNIDKIIRNKYRSPKRLIDQAKKIINDAEANNSDPSDEEDIVEHNL